MKEYNRCCPIESESGSHPVGYDYGNGYKFAFPWLNIFGFVPPEDAKFKEQEVYVHEDGYDKFRTRAGDCTYTTTISDADATDLQVYGVPDYKDFIEIVVGYTISNDQGEDCSIYVEDSLTVIKVEDSPPINCCPIECEPSYHYGTDYNGEGFLYSFPADPGAYGAPTGDEADERCTYTVVIDDPGKLKPTRYYGPSTVTATYTITSAEDDCDVTCDHSLVVELIESECCPIEVEPDDHPKGYDYGKGYTFTWPPQPLLGFAVPEDAGDCTYTTTFDLDDPTVTYFVPDNKDSIEVFGTYTIVNDQGAPMSGNSIR